MGREMPPSVDIPRFRIVDGKVILHCDLCHEDIGSPTYLADAIRLWEEHQKAYSDKRTEAGT